MSVSHETIYQYIYVQAKSGLKKELISMLRRHKPKRQKRGLTAEKRGVIPDMISIEKRPAEVANRSVLGHWEGDLIVGKDHQSALGTSIERSTRYLVADELAKKNRVDFMKRFESGLEEPHINRARNSAVTIGIAYVVGGFVPLTACFLTQTSIDGLKISFILIIICLSFLVFTKARLLNETLS